MLHEEEYGKRMEEGLLRRTFSDDAFDLYIWQDENEDIAEFQLCYKRMGAMGPEEKVLAWKKGDTYRHMNVDEGMRAGGRKASAVYYPDGAFNKESTGEAFARASVKMRTHMKEGIVDFILAKIREYE